MTEKIISDSAVAPDLSTVVAEERATISSAPTGVDGTARETLPNAVPSTVIDNTVLTNAAESVETTALTEYHDTQSNQHAVIPYKGLGIVDANFVFPAGFFRVVERSVPIGTFDIPNTDPSSYPFLRMDLVSDLLGLDFLHNKLNYPAFIRYNLEVQVKVLATNFHFGQLMVVWRPAYAPFLKGQWTGLDLSAPDILCSFMGASWDPYGPYDNVHTASQLPHQILPITAGTSATMELPWTLNYQYVPTKAMCYPSYHIGFLDVYLLTPILPTDIDKPKLQVFARFKDVMGFGYRSVQPLTADNSSGRIPRIKYSQTNSYSNSPYLLAQPLVENSDVLALATPKLATSSWRLLPATVPWYIKPRWPQVTSLREYLQTRKDKKSPSASYDILQRCEVLEMNPLVEFTDLVRGTVQPVQQAIFKTMANIISAFVGGPPQNFGLCKPPDPGIPVRYNGMAPPLASSVCPDFTVSTALTQPSLISNDTSDQPEQINIEAMAAVPTYMGYYVFDNTNRTWSQWYGPLLCRFNETTGSAALMPAGMLASKFMFWRGNMHYRLHFSSSSFVNARFAVMIQYLDDGNVQQGIIPTQYVEVKGDNVVEGDIPYLHPKPWCYTTISDSATPYQLIVQMVDEPVTWKADQLPPIVMSVWVSWTGFQVACPFNGFNMAVPWGFATAEELPKVTEVLESGTLPGTVPARPPRDFGMNDFPLSLYHLSKRYVKATGASLTPLAPWTCLASREKEMNHKTYAVTYAPINCVFFRCFRWIRGSASIVSDQIEACNDKYGDIMSAMATQLIGWHWKAELSYDALNQQSYPFMQKCGQRMLAIRQPYRSNLPFVSGPHVTVLRGNETDDYSSMEVHTMASAFETETLYSFEFAKPSDDIKGGLPFAFAFGDDLCLKQWMGVPIQAVLDDTTLRQLVAGPP